MDTDAAPLLMTASMQVLSRGKLALPSPSGISRAIEAAISSVLISPFEKGVRKSLMPQFISYPTAAGIMALSRPKTHPIGMPKPTWMSAVASTFFAGGREAAS